jgi:uncharacterized integral membrane protein (TIGR00698 family)
MADAAPTSTIGHAGRFRALLPGLLAAVLIGAAATALARRAPVVGAPVLAMLLGLVTRTVLDHHESKVRSAPVPVPVAATGPGMGTGMGTGTGTETETETATGTGTGIPVTNGRGGAALQAGSRFAGRHLLQAAIVVLGTGLSASAVLRIGAASLPVMLGTLTVCLVAAWLAGRWLHIPDPLRTLIGAGTGICGASAIAALSPVVEAADATVAYAVSTIVVYNVTAAIVLPPLGHLLGLGQHAFGLWAGTAVNDTSSVVATGYAYGTAAGGYAVTVKLTRALMIVPVVLGVAALRARRAGSRAGTGAGRAPGAGTPAWRLVPPFLPLFLLAAAANSAGLVPAAWQGDLSLLAGYLIAVALGGIGLGVRVAELRRAGLRPLAFGGLLSVLVAASSLGLQALTTHWFG